MEEKQNTENYEGKKTEKEREADGKKKVETEKVFSGR